MKLGKTAETEDLNRYKRKNDESSQKDEEGTLLAHERLHVHFGDQHADDEHAKRSDHIAHAAYCGGDDIRQFDTADEEDERKTDRNDVRIQENAL